MWGKLTAKLIPEARYWYKMWSSWLAMAWGGIIYVLWDNPSTFGQLVALIPSPYRDHLGGPLALLAAALPIIVRCLKQGSIPVPAAPDANPA